VAADVTPVYGDTAEISKHEREIVFLKPNVVVVFDRVDAQGGLERIWQLNTPISPSVSGARVGLSGSSGSAEITRIHPSTGVTTDSAAWPDVGWANADDTMYGGYRFQAIHDPTTESTRFLHVVALDGAVTASQRDDDGTRLGVAIDLADGTTATVRFETHGVGGSLERRDGAGRVVLDADLRAGVAPLPLYAR
jgi:hypothetical protein